MRQGPGGAASTYLAIALASAAVLLLEIAITRILSVVLWYHFAFLSVSLAMLGLGAPGVWFALRPPSPRALPIALLAAGMALPAAVIAIFKLGRPLSDAARLFPGLGSIFHGGLLLVIVAVLVPLLFLGSAICLLLMRARGPDVGRVYAADLIGATVGAAAVVPLMVAIPTPLIVAGAGFLPLAAAAMVSRGARLPAAVFAVIAIGLMAWPEPFRLHYTKEYAEYTGVLYERWTPTARVTVFPRPLTGRDAETAFGWGLGTRYTHRPVEQMWIEQDGSAGTPITRLRRPAGADALREVLQGPSFEHLDFDVTSLAYQFAPPRRACVIGAGGGRDILCALRAGAEDVDAVELNPGIVEAVSKPFGEFSGDVYHLPGVHAVVSEGRSFLTRGRGGYDLLQISLIDSWAATAAGAFALSENYLYTIEAVRLYWGRLADGGVVSISRYAAGERANELIRLARLALRALEREGVPEPLRHVAVVGVHDVGTVLLLRKPLDDSGFARLDSLCTARGFRRVWPLAPAEAPAGFAWRLVAPDEELAAEGFQLAPPVDDCPFFFQTMPIFGRVHSANATYTSANENSVLLLRGLLGLMGGLAVLLFLAPFAWRRGSGGGSRLWRGSLYFIAIGIAFMLVEVPWIQRFILFLGHPSYATTVVLATLLLAAGLGSLTAARVPVARVRSLGLVLPIVVAIVNLAAGPVFAAMLGMPLAARILASVALLAPAGFVMGFAFPTGMVHFGTERTAWFWAMNGIASVVASVFALALTMAFGLTATVFLGVAAYAAAAVLLGLGRRDEVEVGTPLERVHQRPLPERLAAVEPGPEKKDA